MLVQHKKQQHHVLENLRPKQGNTMHTHQTMTI